MKTEIHSIKQFRGSNLGIIRLDNLAYPGKSVIKFDGEEFVPISYDTYGHPIISEKNFTYYKAIKSIKERKGESLIVKVEYEEKPFSVRRDMYDSLEAIEAAISLTGSEDSLENKLRNLKNLLILRKQASFAGRELETFILYGKYALNSDGRVYLCTYKKANPEAEKKVMTFSEVESFVLGEEVHIPSCDDACAVCGQNFDLNDVESFNVTEDENCKKVHTDCYKKCTEAVNHQKASKIIDAVYDDVPSSEIINRYDEEDDEEKVWYLYHTRQGDVAIRFKNKVIEIKWFGNFKPFNLEELFEKEEVTKRREPDAKIIHAWSADDAIRYLSMVKKA